MTNNIKLKNGSSIKTNDSPLSVWDGTDSSEIVRVNTDGKVLVKNGRLTVSDPQIRLEEGITLRIETIDGELSYTVDKMVTDDDGKAIGYWLTSGVHTEWYDQSEFETMYETGQLTIVQESINFDDATLTINNGP